jgi:hypothetical protein
MAAHELAGGGSALAKANHARVVNLVEILSQPALGAVTPVRLVTGMFDVSYGGNTFYASGQLLQISEIRETMANRASRLSIKVSAVPSSLRSLALDAQYTYVGRQITIWTAALSTAYAVVGTPDIALLGRVGKMTITDRAGTSDGTCEVDILCVDRYARLRTSNERRLSHEQQKHLYPGDTGLRFLTKMREDNTAVLGQR